MKSKHKSKSRKKFAQMKKILGKKNEAQKAEQKQKAAATPSTRYKDDAANKIRDTKLIRHQKIESSMYLKYNMALGPPYRVLVDTNFLNFSVQAKLDVVSSMMECLLAKVFPCVCSCVIAELEKLGPKFKVALKTAKDPRFTRLTCDGTYADDCIVQRVTTSRIYVVGTNDKELKRRLRQIPGVPIMSLHRHKYSIERLPEAFLQD
eukprot:RCo046391